MHESPFVGDPSLVFCLVDRVVCLSRLAKPTCTGEAEGERPYWRIQLCALPWLNFWYIGLLTFHGVHFICELFCLQNDCVCRLHMSLHVTRKGHGLSGRACSMIHSNFSWRETGKEPLAISRVYLIARLDKFISGLGCRRYP